MNVEYLLRMRERFERWFTEVANKYPPRINVDIEALADQLTTIVEGAIVTSRALKDEALMGKRPGCSAAT